MVDLTLFAIRCRELCDIYGIHGISIYTRGHRVAFWGDAYENEIVELPASRRRAFPNRAADRD